MSSEKHQSTIFGMSTNTIMELLIFATIMAIIMFGINKFDDLTAKWQERTGAMEESEFTRYEGKNNITGSTVQTLLSQWKNEEFCVTIKTKTNTTSYNYTSGDLSSAIDSKENQKSIVNATIKAERNYVNPNGKFTCSINRNDNNVITEIVFEQIK